MPTVLDIQYHQDKWQANEGLFRVNAKEGLTCNILEKHATCWNLHATNILSDTHNIKDAQFATIHR